MVVLLHVSIALFSIIYASFTLIKPSQTKFKLNYGLIGATFASGTYLVLSTHAALVSSCLTGLTYLAIVTCALGAAHYKLSSTKEH